MQKVYLKDLWYIENFLTQEEIDFIMTHANKTTGWYTTQRSVSIKNRWIGYDMPLNPPGTICPHRGTDISGDCVFPEPGMSFDPIPQDLDPFVKPGGINDRLLSVLPPVFLDGNAMQSFWPLQEGDDGGGAYHWHFEKGYDDRNDDGMTAAWSLYINDDYEGGILEFQKQNIQIQPKPGMLVCIPLGEDWTHRVTPVTNGVRHTLYGTCFANPNDREVSTSETC